MILLILVTLLYNYLIILFLFLTFNFYFLSDFLFFLFDLEAMYFLCFLSSFLCFFCFFFFFKQKTAYEMLRSLVGSEMCIRDRYCFVRLLNLRNSEFMYDYQMQWRDQYRCLH
eukprot:TRINITY_DN356_c0_g1_i3.p1 TRINITY_DN356_c0_g1~~TRINITY_DN356_c0_g1_i3.p1  ORF type:complete len:113 (-),score=14.29 TRINITY_DN356_c0_g1_i3:37-375(-)